MTMPEANEHSNQLEDGDFSLIYEDEDLDLEEPQIADEIEELTEGKPKVKFQPSEESILCYGAPEDDEAIELLDRRYALEDEIILENGEKILLHLNEEQKLKREVIRNLSEARHNRKLFSEQLKEGAKKLNLSVRQVRRIFKAWVELGTVSLIKKTTSDADVKPHRGKYWYDLSLKIFEDENKGNCIMLRAHVASRIEDQIYEYEKLELPNEIARLEAEGFSGEKLDLKVFNSVAVVTNCSYNKAIVAVIW